MFYQKSIQQIVKEFKTDSLAGLSLKEAKKRLSTYGPNALPTKKKPPLILKFLEQFKSYLVIILIIATVVSFALGETLDAVAISIIVIINAVIGFTQEIGAEKTLESLKQKEILYALVQRNGGVEKIPFSEVVPGDILILEEGAKIPADGRIIESFSLRLDESILTGESAAVNKNPKEITHNSISLADRFNMIYKDTKVLAGRGKAVVTATGKNTEIGKIAAFLEEAKPVKTPLTIELEKIGSMLTGVIGVIALVMFLLNIGRQIPFVESLLISISLSVAAIPEGLPAIVTIVLSLGVKRLADKKTIVKKLVAAETLGAVRIIAADKTGTLTQNKINVVKIYLTDGSQHTVEGEGYQSFGTFFDQKKKIINPADNKQLDSLLKIAVLASNASIGVNSEITGDTTEAALLVSAQRAKINIEETKKSEPRIYEVPFSGERKMMSVVVEINETGDHFLYTKGAPEIIIERSSLSLSEKKEILARVQKIAGEGLRSLAVAKRKMTRDEVKKALEEDILEEGNLTFLGLFAMQDPLRPEVKEALFAAQSAGIRTIMITGDHKQTAYAIAKEAGILQKNDKVLTEDNLVSLTQKELTDEIKKGVNVFARISPMGKLKIIEAIKSLPGTQVAVTGDGVNDAPALTAAHIGVAMGQTGTDITKEVADIVITDDNYATIIDAVREGRIIFANMVKFIRYLISCNISEVIVVAAGVIFATPLPLMPIQILWINLITDGLPALALGVDPSEFDVMKKPPRDLSEGIIHKTRWAYMTAEGTIMGATVFFLFLFSLSHFSYPAAQTMTFSALALSQLVHAFNNRSTRKSLFKLGFFTNKYLVVATVLSVFLQILVVQTDWGNIIFKTEMLDLNLWLIVTLVSLFPFFTVEIKKYLRNCHILP